MTNKKENLRRLGLYLLIAFALSLLLIVFRKPMETSARVSFVIVQLFSFSPAIACLITMAVTKEGFGDMKLFLVMGLLLGTRGIWGAVFLSLIVIFFISVFALITKRKSRKDLIPFGPALVIGTYLAVYLTGM